jgi:6-phosphogluconolactonase
MKWSPLVVLVFAAAATTLATSRATRLVLVGTFTSQTSRGIHAFRFDDATGALTPIGLVAETPNPSVLASSVDGRFVYAVNEIEAFAGTKSGSVTAFAVDAATGHLGELNVVSSEGGGPCHLAIDRTGRYLAVANYSGGTFAVLPIGSDGRLGPARTVLRNSGQGPTSRQDSPHAHMVLFDPTNAFLLGVDLGLDRVFSYRFDANTGSATPNTPSGISLEPGSGPRDLALSPTAPWAFVINELTSSIDALDWDEATGRLEAIGAYSTLPDGYRGESFAAEVAAHRDGHFVYASNRGHDSIAVFAVSGDGQLALVEHEPTRGRTPRHFAIDSTGRWLIAGNQDSNTLAVFSIDQVSGKLEAVGPLADVTSPTSIAFVP